MAGNTKAWLMTNSRKELSFSGHTHSGYALTSHTHSNYALTNHTHTGYAASNHTHSQYVTEVDINQMIEDVIDNYVPQFTGMGQTKTLKDLYVDRRTPTDSASVSINSSACYFLFRCMTYQDKRPFHSYTQTYIRVGSKWYTSSPSTTQDYYYEDFLVPITGSISGNTFTVSLDYTEYTYYDSYQANSLVCIYY